MSEGLLCVSVRCVAAGLSLTHQAHHNPTATRLCCALSLFAWALSLVCECECQEAIDRFDGSLCLCVNLLSVMMIRGCLIPG